MLTSLTILQSISGYTDIDLKYVDFGVHDVIPDVQAFFSGRSWLSCCCCLFNITGATIMKCIQLYYKDYGARGFCSRLGLRHWGHVCRGRSPSRGQGPDWCRSSCRDRRLSDQIESIDACRGYVHHFAWTCLVLSSLSATVRVLLILGQKSLVSFNKTFNDVGVESVIRHSRVGLEGLRVVAIQRCRGHWQYGRDRKPPTISGQTMSASQCRNCDRCLLAVTQKLLAYNIIRVLDMKRR